MLKRDKHRSQIASLYMQCYQRLYVIGLGYLYHWNLVEDAIQNVFLTLIEINIDRFSTLENPKAYIIAMFKNECKRILKKSKNPIVLTDDVENIIQKLASSDNSIANFEFDNEFKNGFQNYLKSLSKEQYDVIHLRLTGLNDEEIAKKLGISIAALRKRTLRAKNKYFKILK